MYTDLSREMFEFQDEQISWISLGIVFHTFRCDDIVDKKLTTILQRRSNGRDISSFWHLHLHNPWATKCFTRHNCHKTETKLINGSTFCLNERIKLSISFFGQNKRNVSLFGHKTLGSTPTSTIRSHKRVGLSRQVSLEPILKTRHRRIIPSPHQTLLADTEIVIDVSILGKSAL